MKIVIQRVDSFNTSGIVENTLKMIFIAKPDMGLPFLSPPIGHMGTSDWF